MIRRRVALLAELHQRIRADGSFTAHSQRFLIAAQAALTRRLTLTRRQAAQWRTWTTTGTRWAPWPGWPGVSVRLLHHYDRIGLLEPSGRSAAGYRIYSLADLKRLRQVLFYRELGFALEDIAQILADPGQDAVAHLRRQHRLLREQISRRQDMLAAIEKELEAGKIGIALTPEEQFEIFGTDKVTGEWAEEAERRWGETQAWAQSQRRAAAYTKQDWIDIQAGAAAINREFLAAMTAGAPADDRRATDVAERHRQHISRWFYDCPHDLHRGLAEMYLADQRFRKNYDDLAPGLARYVHDAILANASRTGAQPAGS